MLIEPGDQLAADVFDFAQKEYDYRGPDQYPYKDINGTAFDPHQYATSATFPKMKVDDMPYTPVLRKIVGFRQGMAVRLGHTDVEQLTEQLVERCKGPCLRAMEDAKLKPADIDEVVLVGGSTRMPAVTEVVKGLTGGREPNKGVNPVW